jgi:hypothetical protein
MTRRRTKNIERSGAPPFESQPSTHDAAHRLPEHEAAAVPSNGAPPPSEVKDRIEKLAYQLYQQRGCAHGDDVRDWLEAERLTLHASELGELHGVPAGHAGHREP